MFVQSPPGTTTTTSSPVVFVAMYDYEAQDTDEVSFVEGDEIIDSEAIDDGWMYGRVRRTGKHGMLPSNYVMEQQLLN